LLFFDYLTALIQLQSYTRGKSDGKESLGGDYTKIWKEAAILWSHTGVDLCLEIMRKTTIYRIAGTPVSH
jgi:hypothetical protein